MRISYKLTLLFLIFVILIQSAHFFFLYSGLYNQRIEEEVQVAFDRAKNYRDMLEDSYNQETIDFIMRLEKHPSNILILMDDNHKLIHSSNELLFEHLEIANEMMIERNCPDNYQDEILLREPYFVFLSPLISNNSFQGCIIMITDMEHIHLVADKFKTYFMMVAVVTAFLFLITIYVLSQFISLPLTRMNEAAKQLRLGNYQVKLNMHRDDELGELASSIQSLSNNLEKVQRERSEFLASISHELRTPLTYLRGYADVAQRKISEEEREKYLKIIHEESKRLTTLVENLFDLAQADRHQLTIQKECVNIGSLSANILQKFELVARERGIMIEFQSADDVFVNVDPLRFGQVIMNVVDNAIKYSPNQSKIIFSIKQVNTKVIISVQDFGQGIPDDQITNVFERFYRVDLSRARETGGTGLGLAITKEIVDLHHATINISSTLGIGTTVTIELESEIHEKSSNR
ncbi:hypothetical protein BHU72_08435 [Desulfuribacillus stibiiarsenatis]|uniref:histidine kinase n=1 Tax=Desulfuribacillus stibiiarsenatis TaxID=1390249 RepID=A0A1E5L3L6_9FIRM|nr:hypothetical protein BHU72_08435 [Desulfuribacillus stibiiarsenatis]